MATARVQTGSSDVKSKVLAELSIAGFRSEREDPAICTTIHSGFCDSVLGLELLELRVLEYINVYFNLRVCHSVISLLMNYLSDLRELDPPSAGRIPPDAADRETRSRNRPK